MGRFGCQKAFKNHENRVVSLHTPLPWLVPCAGAILNRFVKGSGTAQTDQTTVLCWIEQNIYLIKILFLNECSHFKSKLTLQKLVCSFGIMEQ